MISKPRTLDEYVKLKTVWRRIVKYYRSNGLNPFDLTLSSKERHRLRYPRYDEMKRIILNDKALYIQAKQENVMDLPW